LVDSIAVCADGARLGQRGNEALRRVAQASGCIWPEIAGAESFGREFRGPRFKRTMDRTIYFLAARESRRRRELGAGRSAIGWSRRIRLRRIESSASAR